VVERFERCAGVGGVAGPSAALRVRMTGVEVVWAKNGRMRRFFAALRMTAERGVAR